MSCVLLVCNSPFEHVCWSCVFKLADPAAVLHVQDCFLLVFLVYFWGREGEYVWG